MSDSNLKQRFCSVLSVWQLRTKCGSGHLNDSWWNWGNLGFFDLKIKQPSTVSSYHPQQGRRWLNCINWIAVNLVPEKPAMNTLQHLSQILSSERQTRWSALSDLGSVGWMLHTWSYCYLFWTDPLRVRYMMYRFPFWKCFARFVSNLWSFFPSPLSSRVTSIQDKEQKSVLRTDRETSLGGFRNLLSHTGFSIIFQIAAYSFSVNKVCLAPRPPITNKSVYN